MSDGYFGNVELALQVAHVAPENRLVDPDFGQGVGPVPNLDAYPKDFQRLIRGRYSHLVEPEEGQIKVLYKMERLPRLTDGELSVLVPSTELHAGKRSLTIPETEVQVSHKREYHPAIDPEFDDVEEDPDHPGVVKRIGNFEILNRYLSTTFSTFTFNIAEPDNWNELNERIGELKEGSLAEYITTRAEAVHRFRNSPKLAERIDKLDGEFDQTHQELIQSWNLATRSYHVIRDSTLIRILCEYQKAIGKGVYVHRYEQAPLIAIDASGRMLNSNHPNPDRQIMKSDIDDAPLSQHERLPFNQSFQDAVQAGLWEIPERRPDYLVESWNKLIRAGRLANDGSNNETITACQTSLEIMLRGTLARYGDMSHEEVQKKGYKLQTLMRRCESVLASTKKRKGAALAAPIFTKLINITKKDAVSLVDYRNATVHGNSWGDLPNFLARYAVQACGEAICYLEEEAWKHDEPLTLASDLYLWLYPTIQSTFGLKSDIDAMNGRMAAKLLGYMGTEALIQLPDSMPKGSLSRGLVTEFLQS